MLSSIPTTIQSLEEIKNYLFEYILYTIKCRKRPKEYSALRYLQDYGMRIVRSQTINLLYVTPNKIK